MASIVRNGIIYGTSDLATEKQAGLMSPNDKIWLDDYSTRQLMSGATSALSADDDLDNIFDMGVYSVSSGTTPKNWPWSSNSGTGTVVVYRRHGTGAAVQWVMSGMNSSTNYNYRTAFRAVSPSYGTGSWRYVMSSTIPVQRIQIQRGSVSYSDVATNSVTDTAVTFDTEFTSTPYIYLSFDNANNTSNSLNFYSNVGLSSRSRSTTGFTIRLLNNSSVAASFNVLWLAVYVN